MTPPAMHHRQPRHRALESQRAANEQHTTEHVLTNSTSWPPPRGAHTPRIGVWNWGLGIVLW